MKNILLGLLLLSAFSCKTTKEVIAPPIVLAEEGFELKMLFQPNSEYVTDLEQVTSTTMSIPNMPEQSSVSEVFSSSTLKFGPMADNQCDMLIVYDEMDMQISGAGSEQIETPKLAGMKIYGKLIEGAQSIDSIVGVEQSMQNMIEGLKEPLFSNSQIDFPNTMKLGDEFLDTKIIEIPIEEMGSTEMTTDTKYTLIKVTDNIAELATQINLSGKVSVMGKEIPLEGSGSGTMSIDIKQQYSTSSSTTIDQVMNMEMQGMTMMQKITVTMTTKTKKVK